MSEKFVKPPSLLEDFRNSQLSLKRLLYKFLGIKSLKPEYTSLGIEYDLVFYIKDQDLDTTLTYYEEWYEDTKDFGGWVVALNFSDQTVYDFKKARLHNYINFSTIDEWRTLKPEHLFLKIDNEMMRLLD